VSSRASLFSSVTESLLDIPRPLLPANIARSYLGGKINAMIPRFFSFEFKTAKTARAAPRLT
jgi:hypothetical protein